MTEEPSEKEILKTIDEGEKLADVEYRLKELSKKNKRLKTELRTVNMEIIKIKQKELAKKLGKTLTAI